MALSAEERENIRQLVKAGKRNQARSLLSQAIKNDPEDPAAWYGMSQLLSDPKNKIEYLRKASELAPDDQVIKAKLEGLENPIKPPKRKTAWWVWLLLAMTAPILACMCYGMIAGAFGLPIPSTPTVAPPAGLAQIAIITMPPTWTVTIPPPTVQTPAITLIPTETPILEPSLTAPPQIAASPPQQPIALPGCIPPQTPQIGQVIEIVDGDTIHVLIDGHDFPVRYIGMDTPENTTEHEVLGQQASDFNMFLVAGKTVVLYRDQSETDRYDRLLRYVFVGEKFINAELVRAGFAEAKEYPPDTACADFLNQFMLEAQQARIGLWGLVVAVPSLTPVQSRPPSNTGCTIKGNINSEGVKIYHLPGMRDYNRTIIDESKGERWFCTEQEAVAAGWRKAMQ